MQNILLTDNRISQRNTEFFTSFDAAKEKSSRELYSIELRKKSRIHSYSKKRAMSATDEISVPPELIHRLPDSSRSLEQKLQDFLCLISENQGNLPVIEYCLFACNRLFKSKSNSTLYIELGLVDLALDLIKLEVEAVSTQCTWLLVNATAGNSECCQRLMDKQVIETCVWLITKNIEKISENCLWCLANITAGNEKASRYLLDYGFLATVFDLFEKGIYVDNRWVAWILAHISKYESDINRSRYLLNYFVNYIKSSNEISAACLMGIYSATAFSPEKIKLLMEEYRHVIPIIIELAYDIDKSISFRAMKIISSISTTDDENTQQLLDNNILPCLHKNLKSTNPLVRKDAYFTLSNILAGTESQLLAVIDCQCLLSDALEGLSDSSFDIRVEAWECFSILSKKINGPEQFHEELIIHMNSVIPKETDPKILKLIINTFESLLANANERITSMKSLLNDSGCFEEISRKKFHGNPEISDLVLAVIDKYYDYNELHGIPDSPKSPLTNEFLFA